MSPAGAGHSGQRALPCHVYQYHALQLATCNFSNDNLVGEGGFGRVYKGQLADGTLVAVKRLDRHGLQVLPCMISSLCIRLYNEVVAAKPCMKGSPSTPFFSHSLAMLSASSIENVMTL